MDTRTTSAESAAWDFAHRGGKKIFTDEQPATTVKGCGFRDLETALQTLLLVEQPLARWKRYWTVRAMAERAKRHPQFMQHEGMREAVRVFDAWMAQKAAMGGAGQAGPDYRCGDHSWTDAQLKEFATSQRKFLERSALCRHGMDMCTTEAELQRHLREDRATGLRVLREQAHALSSVGKSRHGHSSNWFPFPAPAMAAVFGGPGAHGYGVHLCCEALEASSGEPSNCLLGRCACGCALGGELQECRHSVSVRATETSAPDAQHESDMDVPAWAQWLSRTVFGGAQSEKAAVFDPNCLIWQEISTANARGVRLRDPGGLAALELGRLFPLKSFTVEWRLRRSANESTVASVESMVEEMRFVGWQAATREELSTAMALGSKSKRAQSAGFRNSTRGSSRQPSMLDFIASKRSKGACAGSSDTGASPSDPDAKRARPIGASGADLTTKLAGHTGTVVILSDSD